MTNIVELSALANEIRENGWRLNPAEVKDITDGAARAVRKRFPNNSSEELAPIVARIRAAACEVRSALGRWPETAKGGSFYEAEIDRQLDSDNRLFVIALAAN